ncbi:MAG: glycosyltransferase [Thermoplasmatota archaeon]
MLSKEPAVTVLMVAYKGNEHLREAIESVLGQNFRDMELLIVLDPHPDDICEEMIRTFEDNRIRLVKNERRIGLVRSRNKGLGLAKGEFIAVMDSDDISMPKRLEKSIDYLLRNEDCALVGGLCQVIDDKGNIIKDAAPLRSEEEFFYRLFFYNQLPHSSVMMRTEEALKVGGYREKFAIGEDYDLYLRLMKRGRIHQLPENLVKWRAYDSSVTSKEPELMESEVVLIVKENFKRMLGLEIAREDILLYLDNSIKGRDIASISNSLKNLLRINTMILQTAPEWMDEKRLKRIMKEKYHSLLTGQIVSNKGPRSLIIMIMNPIRMPGLFAHGIRTLLGFR